MAIIGIDLGSSNSAVPARAARSWMPITCKNRQA